VVAYSFKAMFVLPIRAGTKRQTIRATGKRRHARPGDALQLYQGMRTSRCELIALAECQGAHSVSMSFGASGKNDHVLIDKKLIRGRRHLDAFAVRDGFVDWADLREFWRVNHRGVTTFRGVLIQW